MCGRPVDQFAIQNGPGSSISGGFFQRSSGIFGIANSEHFQQEEYLLIFSGAVCLQIVGNITECQPAIAQVLADDFSGAKPHQKSGCEIGRLRKTMQRTINEVQHKR